MATQAFAGPKSDARAYVETTREGAREKARMLFQEYLQGSALESLKVNEYAGKFNDLSENLKNKLADLELQRLRLAQAVEKADLPQGTQNVQVMIQNLLPIYENLSQIYISARAAEKNRDYLILKNGKVGDDIQRSFQLFLKNITTTCENGIAANFSYPSLPAIRPVLPSYSFGVMASVDSGGNFTATPQIPNVQTENLNGDTAAAVYTSAYAGGYVLGAYLITGKVVMTATAAQTLTAAQALGASGIGLGVAAVVALAVYFDGLFSAISKSREVSDALWIVHNDKADAETVREEFKAICKPFAERISKVRDRLSAIDAQDPKALKDIKADRELVRSERAKLERLQTALNERLVAIKAEVEAEAEVKKLNEDQKQELAMQRLKGSYAYVDMQSFIKESKSELLMKMFEVSLIDIGLHIVQVDEAMTIQYQELFKNQTEQHLNKIMNLAMLGRRLAIPNSISELVEAELKANSLIAKLFRQFDANFAGYVQMQLTLGYDDSYKPKLIEWLEEVKKAQKDLPKSETLKVLVSRGQTMLNFIGVK